MSALLPEAVPIRAVARDVWVLVQRVEDSSIGSENCYIVRGDDGMLHIIDPGEDTGDNLLALVSAIESLGGVRAVRTVMLTHLHADHGELAGRVRGVTGAQLILHEREQESIVLLARQTLEDRRRVLGVGTWGVPPDRLDEATHLLPPPELIEADLVVRGDHVQTLPHTPLEFIPTPGHTAGHLCAYDPRGEVLFAGDHLLQRVTPAVGIGGPSATNPLTDYRRSLDRMRAYDDAMVLPGHGEPFRGTTSVIDAIRQRIDRRFEEVSAIVSEQPDRTVWEVASLLRWSRPWSSFSGTYLASALLQTQTFMATVGSSSVQVDCARAPRAGQSGRTASSSTR